MVFKNCGDLIRVHMASLKAYRARMHERRFILFIAIKVLQEKGKCNKVRFTGCTEKEKLDLQDISIGNCKR